MPKQLIQQWIRKPNGWYSRGRTPRSGDDRSLLVRGAYIPDDTTTGPVLGSTFSDQAANGVGIISLTTTNLICENMTHWGEVRHQAPGISHNNCRFAGADFNLMYGGTYGATGAGYLVKSYGGSSYYHWTAENCLFDPWLWVTERGRTAMTDATYVHIDGIEGGDCELRWCRIRNVVDGVHFLHQENITDAGNSGYSEAGFSAPAGQRFCVVDRCLLEKSSYVAGETYRARPGAQIQDARPHSDGIQIMQGKNLLVAGSMIGGVRDSVGYTTWPNTGDPGNTGTDFSNAALMIKQEGTFTSGDVAWINNIVVDKSFLGGGGTFCVNFFVGSGNTLTGVTIKDTKILERKYGDGLSVGDTGTPTSVGSGYGYYRNSTQDSTWTGNTVYETGVSIPSGTNQAGV